MTLEPLLTAKEAADFLRISVWTLLRACNDGDLDYVMVDGEAPCFTVEHLRAFSEHRTVRARRLGPADTQTVSEGLLFLIDADVADILGISVRSVRRLVKEKRLRSIRLTKRKQVFTRGLIEEFLRREAGSIKMTPDGHHFDPWSPSPQNCPISLEESRSLLKDLRKDMSPPGPEERLTLMVRRG